MEHLHYFAVHDDLLTKKGDVLSEYVSSFLAQDCLSYLLPFAKAGLHISPDALHETPHLQHIHHGWMLRWNDSNSFSHRMSETDSQME